jgi:uncharacterized protein YndB with AHSA1/START domain
MAVNSRSASLTLPTDEQILVTREFNAPKELVYKAWTTPELVKRWWHANRGEVTVVEIDLRAGGKWRSASVTDDGMEVAFHGEYQEVEGIPNGEESATLNTVTFEESGGRTIVTLLIEAPSKDVRDAIVASGMEDGLQDALDLLEETALSLR